MKMRTIFLASLSALITLTAYGQDNRNPNALPRDSGTAAITGRVMLPSGMTTASHVKIILSNRQAPLVTLYLNDNGEFSFKDLYSGIYYIEVLADQSLYEAFKQEVKINPAEPAFVILYLKERKGPVARASRGNVVSIAEEDSSVPDLARKTFEHARKLIEKKDFDAAIVELNKAVAIHPDYVSARNYLGVQYLKLKRLAEAAEQFKTILEKNPKYYNARLNLGIVMVEQKRFTDAVEELRQAVTLDSSQPAAHLFWGIAALDLNDLETAERELVKALLLGGAQYSNAHYYFAHVYLKTGRRVEAARELKLFLETAQPGEMAVQARALLQQLTVK
ncbi:MAG: tetratricopeptide repeat protein [Blastocatellia bacterium]